MAKFGSKVHCRSLLIILVLVFARKYGSILGPTTLIYSFLVLVIMSGSLDLYSLVNIVCQGNL
jgi:hypothetical protein